MNDVTVLRVSTAMAKIMAAMKSVFGMAKTRMPSRWACQLTGPQRSAIHPRHPFADQNPDRHAQHRNHGDQREPR